MTTNMNILIKYPHIQNLKKNTVMYDIGYMNTRIGCKNSILF